MPIPGTPCVAGAAWRTMPALPRSELSSATSSPTVTRRLTNQAERDGQPKAARRAKPPRGAEANAREVSSPRTREYLRRRLLDRPPQMHAHRNEPDRAPAHTTSLGQRSSRPAPITVPKIRRLNAAESRQVIPARPGIVCRLPPRKNSTRRNSRNSKLILLPHHQATSYLCLQHSVASSRSSA